MGRHRDPPARPKPPPIPPFVPPFKDRPPKEKLHKLDLLLESCLQEVATPPGLVVQLCPAQPLVTIGIQEAPQAHALLAGGSLTLHAINRTPPAGGVLTWAVPGPVVTPSVLNHGMTFDVQPAQAGSAQVTLRHRVGPAFADANVLVNVVHVTIQEAPRLAVRRYDRLTGALSTFTLAAHGLPANGVYAWTPLHAPIADFQGPNPGDQAQATFAVGNAGAALVQVTYTLGGVAAQATIPVDVVDLTVQEGAELAVSRLTAGAATTFALHGLGIPANGVYAWGPRRVEVARFQGNVNPGNQANATFETRGGGSTNIDLTYTVGAAVVEESIIVDVVDVEIQEAPRVPVLLDDAGEDPNAVQLHAVGRPAAGSYAWAILAGGSVAFPNGNPGNQATIDLGTAAAGTSRLSVTYTVGNVRATADVHVHVVGVRVQQGHRLTVDRAAGNFQLVAIGGPVGGTFDWAVHGGSVQFPNAVVPQNVPQAAVEPVAFGGARVDVGYTFRGLRAATSIRVRVIEVAIRGPAQVYVALATNPAATIHLQAVGRDPGGVYAWTVVNAAIVDFPNGRNPDDTDRVTLETRAAGTTNVQVSYTHHGLAVVATVQCHVVGVTIQEGPNCDLLTPFAGAPGVAAPAAATLQLHATGAPAMPAGTYAWNPPTGQAARYLGGNAPGAVANPTIEAVQTGGSRFTVRYTLGGATAQARVRARVNGGCSRALWTPTVAPPVGAAAHVGVTAAARCTHEGNNQRPGHPNFNHANGNGPATIAPWNPHHHGGVCPVCSAANHGVSYHWIEPDTALNQAAIDALVLRNQIQSCVAAWRLAWSNTAGNHFARRNAARVACTAHVTTTHAWPWLTHIDFGGFWPAANYQAYATPKMFGILRGRDQGGNQVRLHAISGQFPAIGTAQPNAYWSPLLPNRLQISGATQGQFNYGIAPHVGGTANRFGTCAASKLLTHALHLGLGLDSMAEVWVGPTRNFTANGAAHARQDGQLQASCDQCRIYLGRMLCDQGAIARHDAFPFVLPNPDPQPQPPNHGF